MKVVLAVLVAAMLFLVGCGGGDDAGGGGTSQTSETGTTKGAEKAPSLAESKDAKGTVTMCAGKDTSGCAHRGDQGLQQAVRVPGAEGRELQELAADANEVRNQFIQREQAKSAECDVLQTDIIWTAEFAQQKWLLDMTDYAKGRAERVHPLDAVLLPLRRQVLGPPAGHRRRPAVPPHRPGPRCPEQLAGHDEGRRPARRPGDAGRALRGPDLRLHRAVLERRRRVDPLRRRLQGGVRQPREPEGAEAAGRRHEVGRRGQGTRPRSWRSPRGPRSRPSKATFMRNWSYAYALGKKSKIRQQVRGQPAAAVRRRQGRRRARRQRPGRSPRTPTTPRARCCGSTSGPRRR